MLPLAEYNRRLTDLLSRQMFQHKKSIGFDIPRGWLELVEHLVADLEALPDGDRIRCIQAKEKFGSLRFYLANDHPRIDFITGTGVMRIIRKHNKVESASAAAELISAAERLSATTCILCGSTGHIVEVDGWYSALCPEHAALSAEELSRAVQVDDE